MGIFLKDVSIIATIKAWREPVHELPVRFPPVLRA